MSDFEAELKCMHCGDAVIFTGHTAKGFDTDYMHANMIRRCLPAKSGKPYGLEADISQEPRLTPLMTVVEAVALSDEIKLPNGWHRVILEDVVDIDEMIDSSLDTGSQFR